MYIPGFIAKASLYRSSAHYGASCCSEYVDSSQISLQACDGFKQLFCNSLVLERDGYLAFWPSIPFTLGCYAASLSGWYGYCRECLGLIDILPAGGRGGVPKTCAFAHGRDRRPSRAAHSAVADRASAHRDLLDPTVRAQTHGSRHRRRDSQEADRISGEPQHSSAWFGARRRLPHHRR